MKTRLLRFAARISPALTLAPALLGQTLFDAPGARSSLYLAGSTAPSIAYGLAIADIGGDHDVGVAVNPAAGPNRRMRTLFLFENDRLGNLSASDPIRLPPGRDDAGALCFADVDGDGDADRVKPGRGHAQPRRTTSPRAPGQTSSGKSPGAP